MKRKPTALRAFPLHQAQGIRCKEYEEDEEVEEERSNPAWTAEPNREKQMENYSDAVICLPPLSTHIQEAHYKYENLS